MCKSKWCPCGWPDKELTDEFVSLFGFNYTAKEEAYVDTEPDIAGPLRELDARQRAEKNLRNRRWREGN